MKFYSLLIVVFLCLSTTGLLADKPDSVYINNGFQIQFIYLTDSIPTVREYDFYEYFDEYIERGINLAEAYEPEVEERHANKDDLEDWSKNPHRVFAYDDLEFNKDFDSVLIGKQMYEYIFFAPDRYALIDGDMQIGFDGEIDRIDCETNNYMQYSIDSLNILLLFYVKGYSNYTRRNIELDRIITPLKDDRYFSDTINTLQPDTLNGDYQALFSYNMYIFDVDTFSINGKYGLYTTLTKKEIIPAIYDSLKTDDAYVRAFDGKTTIIFDYMGNVFKDNIKRAYPVRYRYRILDNNNHVYWLDLNGQEHDDYSYQIKRSLPFLSNVVLTPPQKKGYGKKRTYHLVEFFDLNRLYEADEKEHFDVDTLVYEIPFKYKNPTLINGEHEFNKNDYYSDHDYFDFLDDNLVIAKRKGKYGVINVGHPKSPVIPFVYDKIETNYGISLTLHKKGLKCYYPISKTPHYKELSPFMHRDPYIRFTLPNGEQGWLLKNGEEFLDNAQVKF